MHYDVGDLDDGNDDTALDHRCSASELTSSARKRRFTAVNDWTLEVLVQMLTLASAVTRDALWAARVGHVA